MPALHDLHQRFDVGVDSRAAVSAGGEVKDCEGGVARFVLVYISEAHAQNEWPVGDPVALDQALTLDDRVAHASAFREAYFPLLEGWKVAVDDPQPRSAGSAGDQFDRAYAAWPTRFYVLDGRSEDSPVRLVWKAQPESDNEYKIEELERFLGEQEHRT